MKKRKGSPLGTIKILCACALLCAAAVTIAYVCKFMTIGSIRITFENLPIIIAGIFFGPVAGLATGLCADLISTAVSFYGIGGLNPIITLGAGSIGFFAGLVFNYSKIKADWLKALLAVFTSHVIGNMVIKSIGIMVYYSSYNIITVLPRIPLYLIIGTIEYIIIMILIKNKGINKSVGRLK